MSINIRDIAEKCRVSKSTVSRVLNNDDKVKEETRQKVLKMLAEQNYNPLDHIPSLFRTRTRALGMVLGTTVAETSPFFNRAFASFRKATGTAGYETRFFTTQELAHRLWEAGAERNLGVDGLIFFAPHGDYDRLLEKTTRLDVPSVLVRRKTKVPGIPCVYDDDYTGSRLAYDYLHSLGHTRIGLVGGDLYTYLGSRWESFRDFVADRHLPQPNPNYHWSEKTGMTLEQWAAALAGEPDHPTALVCASDFVAITVIKELGKIGIRVPEDMNIIGYDNDHVAELFSPAITTVNIPVREMITYAVRLLDDRLHGQDNGNVEIKVKNELVIRESTDTAGNR